MLEERGELRRNLQLGLVFIFGGGGTFLKWAPQGAHLTLKLPLLQGAGAIPCGEVVRVVLAGGFAEPMAWEVLTCHAGTPGDATLASALEQADPEMGHPGTFIFSKYKYGSVVQLS